jgi:hypothetical protein
VDCCGRLGTPVDVKAFRFGLCGRLWTAVDGAWRSTDQKVGGRARRVRRVTSERADIAAFPAVSWQPSRPCRDRVPWRPSSHCHGIQQQHHADDYQHCIGGAPHSRWPGSLMK